MATKGKSRDINKSFIKPLADDVCKKTQTVLLMFFGEDHRKPNIMFQERPVDPSLSKKCRVQVLKEVIEALNASLAYCTVEKTSKQVRQKSGVLDVGVSGVFL